MPIRAAITALALLLSMPLPALAQTDPVEPLPPLPCPWWDCRETGPVVVEEYRVETTIDGPVATTRITQALRNDGSRLAEGRFLMPIPTDAAVTGLTLWIDDEPVSGEILDGEAARRTYEQIVRDTLDPALLEFVDDDLLRLSVFPIPAGAERKVEVEYRQVLAADGGLVRYRQPMGREHNGVEIERIVTRIEIVQPDGVKAVHSPTHEISIQRTSDTRVIVGHEGQGRPDSDFVLYFSTDAAPISLDVLSHRDGDEGWFLLLASPGLAAADDVTPKDVVLVLDVSGSMEGEKLAQARRAAAFVLGDLNPDDRFEVLAFATGIQSFGGGLSPASEAGPARTWVSSLAAGGSTNIHGALTDAFALAEPGRPLYVMFLTDGLPTEGPVDTAEILGALQPTETTSVFAFGVGFDVDTILLDSLARQHHGVTEYVVPGEEIDTAVASLSEKVSSPVMTAVQLEIDGVTVFDLHPTPLPDIFSGGQLVLAGRYAGSGPATVTLSGRLRGDPITITYDDVTFRESGGDDSVARLWATRKIGALLRQIRIEGPTDETIDQIVRISIRHGIVTPYTSYLVTEPAPFGADALEDITRAAAASTTTYAASGEAAVDAASAAANLSATDFFGGGGEYADVVQAAGGRTFRLSEGIWIDTTFDPDMENRRIGFGTDDYFALAALGPEVADALSIGANVTVVVDGIAYTIVTDDGPVDELAEQTTTTRAGSTTTTTTVPGEALGAEDPASGDGTPSALLIALAVLVVASGGLVFVTRRRA
jgi:Ca-activated chloride channel family protein